MPAVLPFPGLRFDPRVVGNLAEVVCPPYDVISPAEHQALLERSARNVVRVELPEDLPGQPGSRYDAAAGTLRGWEDDGTLVRDSQPAYYLHETQFAYDGRTHRRRDLIAALELQPWAAGAILPHERTMAGPKADRMALLRAANANVSPVWVMHREPLPALEAAWQAAESGEPAADFSLDGERHRLWVVDDPATVRGIQAAFSEGEPLYIADGHHRYETALAFRDEAGTDLPAARATLAVVTWAGDPGLLVLPTHRLLSGLPSSLDAEELETRWSDAFHSEYYPVWEGAPADQIDAFMKQVESSGRAGPSYGILGPDPETFAVLELRGRVVPEGSMPADRSDAWKALDVSILHVLLVDPLVGQTGKPREEALTYTRDPVEAFRSVREGAAEVAFFLNPTRVDQVLAVADAGDRMPEKSTYFHPKPPTGLVIRDLRQPT